MNGEVLLREPSACTETELFEFERMVRLGFGGSDERLPGRIRAAKWLGFHYLADNTIAAVAALKQPGERSIQERFTRAGADVGPRDFTLELGWVWVARRHRGDRIATGLCQGLLKQVRPAAVFATTRPDNAAMIRILLGLGFERAGGPFPRRDEELLLFVLTRSIQGSD